MSFIRNLVIGLLEWVSGIALILFVIIVTYAGAEQAGFLGFLGGAILGTLFGAVIFGTLFLLMEINKNVKAIAERDGGGG